ncbi:hypothetical protein DFH07DRAFT_860723 [Mycena maculata]|uniref:Uncharacterized protein n=1 Tax=Mycena maculata TaxID=230809 RepID=A0AAD7MI62_9AGAR|nr:hypothetical protein DFH07DRAFT_860723 [Mycena maculata]
MRSKWATLKGPIAGANAANWQSVLVGTGVFNGGIPTHQPTHQAEDVEEAVRWAITREMQKGKHATY